MRSIAFVCDCTLSTADQNANIGLEAPEFLRKKFDLIMLHKILYDQCSLILHHFVVERSSFILGSFIHPPLLPKAGTYFRHHVYSTRTESELIKLSKQPTYLTYHK